jgi:hypothetical protein
MKHGQNALVHMVDASLLSCLLLYAMLRLQAQQLLHMCAVKQPLQVKLCISNVYINCRMQQYNYSVYMYTILAALYC